MPHIRCFDFHTVTQLTTFCRLVARAVVPLLKGLILIRARFRGPKGPFPLDFAGESAIHFNGALVLFWWSRKTRPVRSGWQFRAYIGLDWTSWCDENFRQHEFL